jgi:hypothetical protein
MTRDYRDLVIEDFATDVAALEAAVREQREVDEIRRQMIGILLHDNARLTAHLDSARQTIRQLRRESRSETDVERAA